MDGGGGTGAMSVSPQKLSLAGMPSPGSQMPVGQPDFRQVMQQILSGGVLSGDPQAGPMGAMAQSMAAGAKRFGAPGGALVPGAGDGPSGPIMGGTGSGGGGSGPVGGGLLDTAPGFDISDFYSSVPTYNGRVSVPRPGTVAHPGGPRGLAAAASQSGGGRGDVAWLRYLNRV